MELNVDEWKIKKMIDVLLIGAGRIAGLNEREINEKTLYSCWHV